MLIDAHVHLPTGNTVITFQEKKEFLLAGMKKNGVDQCILIADSWPVSEIGSNKDCMSLFPAGNCDGVHVVGGISPLKDFDRQLEVIRFGIEKKALVGIKLFTGHEAFYLTDERLDIVYDLALQTGTPVLFHSGWDNRQYSDVPVAEKIAKKYPDLRLVCCHCWYPMIGLAQRLFDYPNVFFDFSSVADEPGKYEKLAEEAELIIRTVPDRVLYGSDAFGCSMEQHLSFFRNLDLPEEISRKFFAENAKRIYLVPDGERDPEIT